MITSSWINSGSNPATTSDSERLQPGAASPWNAVLEKAVVPEHSVFFMQAMSGGEPFLAGPYLFLAGDDWLVAVGYPLEGQYDPEEFSRALREAQRRTKPRDCWAICPALPGDLQGYLCEQDHYYLLPAAAPVPRSLERQAARAALTLAVEEAREFTPAHCQLWAEFLARKELPPRVRNLFIRTPEALAVTPQLLLLNAWDQKSGQLAACLLLDLAPQRFLSYLIGAHSRSHYTAHAADLLFSEMIRIARRENKEFLHLGLGVNSGLRRFKRKWGGMPTMSYEMAAWEEDNEAGANVFLQVLAAMPTESQGRQLEIVAQQQAFRMLWEVEKDQRRSWIGGTAHFFPHSFEFSLRELFKRVETVLFEGPLDQPSLERISASGRTPAADTPRLADLLRQEEIVGLKKVVCGPQGFWARLLGWQAPDPPDVDFYLNKTHPWMAFFSLWAAYLTRKGWRRSVDLEAYQLARQMNKFVCNLETIAEQVATLESIPIPRLVDFLRQCRHWNALIRRHERAYLKGNLETLGRLTSEFPTRTSAVIDRRDQIFFDRMMPFLERGECAVFVGTLHLLNLLPMLRQAGFTVSKAR